MRNRQGLNWLVDGERLASLRSYRVLDSLPEAAYDGIVRRAAQSCGVPYALISFLEPHRQWFKASVGLPWRQTPLRLSICAKGLELGGVFVVTNAQDDPRVNANPLVYADPHISFYAGVPLMDPCGRPLGMLCVLDVRARPDGLDTAQAGLLAQLAQEVMGLLEAGKARAR